MIDQAITLPTIPANASDNHDGIWTKHESALVAKWAQAGVSEVCPDNAPQCCADAMEMPVEGDVGEVAWLNIVRGNILVASVTVMKNRFEAAFPGIQFYWLRFPQGAQASKGAAAKK